MHSMEHQVPNCNKIALGRSGMGIWIGSTERIRNHHTCDHGHLMRVDGELISSKPHTIPALKLVEVDQCSKPFCIAAYIRIPTAGDGIGQVNASNVTEWQLRARHEETASQHSVSICRTCDRTG